MTAQHITFLWITILCLKWQTSIPTFKTHKMKIWKKNDWKKSALFIKEWWSGAHSIFENGSERVSALIFLLMSESWAKLKKLMSVEHVVCWSWKVERG
jgi:hypothetical protein